VAIGVGGALVDPRLVAAGDYAAITDRAKRFVERVRNAREASA
jgi:2-keto-3-deoxy-6-phosphogluconate aldolase